MGADGEHKVLRQALDHAVEFLDGLGDRPVAPRHDVDQVAAALSQRLPEEGTDDLTVIDELVAVADPGLLATPSGRFFGWVIGGTLPSALAADWLTSTWDQNAGLLASSPAAAGVERVAAAWLLDLLGLPPTAAVGFVTGAMMANFTCLAAARHEVLRRVGWDVEGDGLSGAPPITVLVGAERHDTVDIALRYLGLGERNSLVVPVDGEGRVRPRAVDAMLAKAPAGPLIVCLQAGNVHSGAFDPLATVTEVAHIYDAWVHVDGAFGLWAAASPRLKNLTDGVDWADSWATDAHKTLNVPYDSGLAIVRDPAALYAAMGEHAGYLIQDERPDPLFTVPEFSRRARGFAVWAALRSLGRRGVGDLVERLCDAAQRFAAGLTELDGVHVLNDVVFNQVVVSFGSDDVTREVARRLLTDGTAWMTPSTWHGHAVLRISVANWRTTPEDVDRALAAVRRVLMEVRAER